jgi:hypothetical protein
MVWALGKLSTFTYGNGCDITENIITEIILAI